MNRSGTYNYKVGKPVTIKLKNLFTDIVLCINNSISTELLCSIKTIIRYISCYDPACAKSTGKIYMYKAGYTASYYKNRLPGLKLCQSLPSDNTGKRLDKCSNLI